MREAGRVREAVEPDLLVWETTEGVIRVEKLAILQREGVFSRLQGVKYCAETAVGGDT